MVIFGQKWLHSGKKGCIRAKWFYFGKVVVFGQKWFYSGKSCSIRAKVVVFPQSGSNWANVVEFGQSG